MILLFAVQNQIIISIIVSIFANHLLHLLLLLLIIFAGEVKRQSVGEHGGVQHHLLLGHHQL